jgi:hypothetical protein
MGRIPVLAVVIALGLSVGACGPIAYVNEVTRRASGAVESARAAQADKYAPYYWTRATQYLHQAREKAAHSDFQGANRFGRLAAEAGEIATTEAMLAAKDPSKRPLELQHQVAPAKDTAPASDKVAPAKDEP